MSPTFEAIGTEGAPLTMDVLRSAAQRLRGQPPERHVHVIHPTPYVRGDRWVRCASCLELLDMTMLVEAT